MGKLPPLRRLTMQDFVSQSSWIGPLLQNLNAFVDGVYGSLNQAITLHDNSTGDVLSTTLTAQPTPASPANVPWTKPNTPQAVILGGLQQRDTSKTNSLTTSGTLLTAAPALEWQYVTSSSGNFIQITNLVGAPTPSTTLTLTLQLVVLTE